MPVRVQLRRTKGWRMPENTVSVARPQKWGNPFVAGRHADADTCVEAFRNAVGGFFSPTPFKHLTDDEFQKMYVGWERWRKRLCGHPYERLWTIRGKNLACWCKPGDPCHADVLLELANAPPAAA